MEIDDGTLYVIDDDLVEDWIRPYLNSDGCVDETEGFWKDVESREGDNGWPLVHVEWNTISVFLTRNEAEEWAKARAYRWEKWRVYCIPCDGELAKVLNEYEPKEAV